MSLRWFEGFDHISTDQMFRKWTSVTGSGQILGPGRFAGACWNFNSVNGPNNNFIYMDMPTVGTFYFGLAFSMEYGDGSGPTIVLGDGNSTQIDVRFNADASISVTRNGTVLDTTPAGTFTFKFFHYLEMKVVISDTDGEIILKVDGQTHISRSSLDTQNTLHPYITRFRLQPFPNQGAYNIKFDDIYFLDALGTTNNNFLGEVRVQTNYPNANGDVNNFTSYGASNNWQCVNQIISDDDATYSASGHIGDKDLYRIQPFNFTGAIFGVQASITYRKDDVGVRTIAPLVRIGTTDFEGNQFVCGSDYKIASKIWETNPFDDSSWTISGVNNAEFGVIIKA